MEFGLSTFLFRTWPTIRQALGHAIFLIFPESLIY
jgi:hypothetical protein